MTNTKTALLPLLLGSLLASRLALSQEPPTYQGNDASSGAEAPAPSNGEEPANDPAVASVDYFHQQLAPYGQWVTREGYGEVWAPQVAAGWRPYTTGHWVYTDQGWAWVAEEPWGWAAFHYGRWFYDQEIGWAWVPGTVWAPAWVAWRYGGGYLGWAPLSPAVGFTLEGGLDFGAVVITPGFYTFVGERDILAPRVATVILSSTRNVSIVGSTINYTHYTMSNGRVVNAGVSAQRIAQVTGQPVPRVAVASMAAAGARGKGAFYQPAVVTKAATMGHAEFGKALPTQVAAQQKSRSFARPVAGSKAAATPSGQAPRAPGAAAGQSPARNPSGAPADQSKGHVGVGIDASHGPAPSRAPGAAAGQTPARNPSGASADQSKGHVGVGIDASHGPAPSRAPGATAGQTPARNPSGASADQSTHAKGHFGVGIDASHGPAPSRAPGAAPGAPSRAPGAAAGQAPARNPSGAPADQSTHAKGHFGVGIDASRGPAASKAPGTAGSQAPRGAPASQAQGTTKPPAPTGQPNRSPQATRQAPPAAKAPPPADNGKHKPPA